MSYAENMITFRAMFGRNMPDGLEVSDAAMTNYLKAVDRVFDCYTVTDTVGIWKGDRELSFIIEITVPVSEEYLTGHKLAALAELYKLEFDQEAVFITKTHTSGWFV